jgi:hypothetical protein
MTNPFLPSSLIPTWDRATEILKGGPGSGALAGHAFNGNQWTNIGSGDKAANSEKTHNDKAQIHFRALHNAEGKINAAYKAGGLQALRSPENQHFVAVRDAHRDAYWAHVGAAMDHQQANYTHDANDIATANGNSAIANRLSQEAFRMGDA